MTGVHPPGRHVLVRGHRLWVEEEGQGPPVLLLAGLGPAGSHAIFHPHFSPLAQLHRLIYVDLHGRGRSDPPKDLTQLSFAEDVLDIAALLEALELNAVHLYGFSYGGLIAQALALRHAERLASLTLANSLHSPQMWQLNHENINREIAAMFPERWARITELHEAGIVSTDPRCQAEFAPVAAVIRFYNPDNAVRMFTEPGARNTALYSIFCGEDVDFAVGNRILEIPDFRPLLGGVQIPFLIIAGRHDRALYPALQLEFAQAAPQAKFLMFEKSGSFAHIEEPELLHRTLAAFWEEARSFLDLG